MISFSSGFCTFRICYLAFFIGAKKMSEPKIAQKFPYKKAVVSDKSYYWCRCGQSSKQPFCDGSHEGTDFLPEKINFDEAQEVYFCGCKNSSNQPFCDGTHKDL